MFCDRRELSVLLENYKKSLESEKSLQALVGYIIGNFKKGSPKFIGDLCFIYDNLCAYKLKILGLIKKILAFMDSGMLFSEQSLIENNIYILKQFDHIIPNFNLYFSFEEEEFKLYSESSTRDNTEIFVQLFLILSQASQPDHLDEKDINAVTNYIIKFFDEKYHCLSINEQKKFIQYIFYILGQSHNGIEKISRLFKRLICEKRSSNTLLDLENFKETIDTLQRTNCKTIFDLQMSELVALFSSCCNTEVEDNISFMIEIFFILIQQLTIEIKPNQPWQDTILILFEKYRLKKLILKKLIVHFHLGEEFPFEMRYDLLFFFLFIRFNSKPYAHISSQLSIYIHHFFSHGNNKYLKLTCDVMCQTLRSYQGCFHPRLQLFLNKVLTCLNINPMLQKKILAEVNKSISLEQVYFFNDEIIVLSKIE